MLMKFRLKFAMQNSWSRPGDQDVSFIVMLPCNPQTTTDQTPAEMLMMRRTRFRLDLVYPAVDNRVLDKQTNHCAGASRCSVVYAGDVVWVVNFVGIHRYQIGSCLFHCRIDGRPSPEKTTSVSGFPRRVTTTLKRAANVVGCSCVYG